MFPKSGNPSAAMVIEADFVVSEITGNSANYVGGTTGKGGAACTADPTATPCYNFFAFPAPRRTAPTRPRSKGRVTSPSW